MTDTIEHEPQSAWESLMTWDDGSPGIYEGASLINAPWGEGEAEPEEDDGFGFEWEAGFAWNNSQFYAQPETYEHLLPVTPSQAPTPLPLRLPNEPYFKKPIPAKLRWAVFRRDGYRCVLCGCDEDLTADHIHPEVKGGKATIGNLRTLCRPCNSSKGAR